MSFVDRLLHTFVIDHPEAAMGAVGVAFVVVEFPVEDERASPFEGNSDDFHAAVILLLRSVFWLAVFLRPKAVFANENAFASDVGLWLQFRFEIVERGTEELWIVLAVVGRVGHEIDGHEG